MFVELQTGAKRLEATQMDNHTLIDSQRLHVKILFRAIITPTTEDTQTGVPIEISFVENDELAMVWMSIPRK